LLHQLKTRGELRRPIPYELHDSDVVFRGKQWQEIIFLEYETNRTLSELFPVRTNHTSTPAAWDDTSKAKPNRA